VEVSGEPGNKQAKGPGKAFVLAGIKAGLLGGADFKGTVVSKGTGTDVNKKARSKTQRSAARWGAVVHQGEILSNLFDPFFRVPWGPGTSDPVWVWAPPPGEGGGLKWKPGRDQIAAYAQRKGMTVAEVERWLGASLGQDGMGAKRKSTRRRRRLLTTP